MKWTPSDDLIDEHQWLIERGVRPIASIGAFEEPELSEVVGRIQDRIDQHNSSNYYDSREFDSIVFTMERDDGFTEVGIAATPYMRDVWLWIQQNAPESYIMPLNGMMLGYSVASFEKTQDCLLCRERNVGCGCFEVESGRTAKGWVGERMADLHRRVEHEYGLLGEVVEQYRQSHGGVKIRARLAKASAAFNRLCGEMDVLQRQYVTMEGSEYKPREKSNDQNG